MAVFLFLVECFRAVNPVGEDDHEVAGDQDERFVADFDEVMALFLVGFVLDGVADREH